jgi:hypothetical protein
MLSAVLQPMQPPENLLSALAGPAGFRTTH